MTPEAKTQRIYKSFPKERREARPIRDGSFPALVLHVKPELGFTINDTTGVGDSDFWINIDDQTEGLTPKQAAHDFYRHNIGHKSLAKLIVMSFQQVRTAYSMGELGKEQRKVQIDAISRKLYKIYPPRYRRMISE